MVSIPVVTNSVNAVVPVAATAGSAGFDLCSTEVAFIPPGGRRVVGTGLCVAIPNGMVGMVCSRSGLAAKHGVCVLNAPGIIDSDYRGEVKVILMNLGESNFSINVGDRVAQMVFCDYKSVKFDTVQTLPETVRGEGGLGSTGR